MRANTAGLRLLLTLAPILLSLVITALLIVSIGHDPAQVFTAVWEGAFRNLAAFAGVVNFWIPLALCCMGLVVTFTAGLWNIGVEGQMMMGAIWASYAAQFVSLPQPLLIGVEIVLAMIGGAVWGLLIGLLKTRFKVNEIFGGVAMNGLANIIAIHLVSGPWREAGSNALATSPFPTEALLPPIANEFPVSLLALVLTVLSIVGVTLALNSTRWGLQLKAAGKNPRSALLLGVPTEQVSLSAFMVCGAVAGIGGAYRVLFTFGSLRPLVSGGIGFLALLVVLVVGTRPLWVPAVSLIFAAILAGSTRLRVALQLDQSIAGVLQGLTVLLVLMGNGLRARLSERSGSGTPDVAPAAPVTHEPPLKRSEAAAHE
jgi:simple sugar transport system permease protein